MKTTFAIAAAAALTLFAGLTGTQAAPSLFCHGYAFQSVGQYHLAVAKGVPGIGFPRWHGDRDMHRTWCEQSFVTEQAMNAEIAVRQYIIDNH